MSGAKYPSHRNSFFAVLHYDIRQIIYSFLLPEELPPFVPTIPSSILGFATSCKLAYEEVLHPAKRNLHEWIEDRTTTFAEATTITPGIKHDLKTMCITLPFEAFQDLNTDPGRARWKREVISNLHPFFTLFFDAVRIHIHDNDDTAQQENIDVLGRAKLEVAMQRLLRDITYIIERVQRAASGIEEDPPLRPHEWRGPVVDAIFKYSQIRPAHYPSDPINAERICLTWDLRTPPNDGAQLKPPILNGKLHHLISDKVIMAQDSTDRVRLVRSAVHRARTLLPQDIAFASDNSSLKHAMFYQLRDSGRLAGEMGLISLTRWSTMVFDFYLNRLVNGRFTRAEMFYCKAFGGELKRGLEGITEDEFESEEKEIGRLLYDT